MRSLIVLVLCGLLAACTTPNGYDEYGGGYGSESSYAQPAQGVGLNYFYFSSGHHHTSYGFGFSSQPAYGSGYGLGYNSLAYGGQQGPSVNACYHESGGSVAQIPCPLPTTQPQSIKYYPCYDTIMGRQCLLAYFY